MSDGGSPKNEAGATAGPVIQLKRMPLGPMYRLDDFRYEGRPLPWITIGTLPNCHIQLDLGDGDDEHHCLLRRVESRLLVRDDRNDGSTMINGIPIAAGSDEIFAGNLLTVGGATFLACGSQGEAQELRIVAAEQKKRIADLQNAGPHQNRPTAERKTMTRTRDKSLDGSFDPVRYLRRLPSGPLLALHDYLDLQRSEHEVTLGAAPTCDITLVEAQDGRDGGNDVRTVSAHHCSLLYRESTWYVRDQGSTNGTYINGVPLAGGDVELVAGSLVTISRTTFLACGERGAAQEPRLAAPPHEYAHKLVAAYGSRSKAAKALGIPRSTFLAWLDRVKP